MDVWHDMGSDQDQGMHSPARRGPARRGQVPRAIAAELVLMEVLRAGRALVALQDRSTALARAAQAGPASLTDAIERDFLIFDLQDAVVVLRDAIAAADALGATQGA